IPIWLAIILFLSLVTGLVIALRINITPFAGAVALDALFDLKERIGTAIEICEQDKITNSIAICQLKDAVSSTKSVEPTAVRIEFPKEITLTLLFLIICVAVTLITPVNSLTTATIKDLQLQETIRIQLARQSLKEHLPEAVSKSLDETAKKIEKGDFSNALLSISALKKKLLQQHAESVEKEQILTELETYNKLTKIAQALRGNSKETLAEEAQHLSTDNAGATETAQLFKNIAHKISENALLAKAVEDAANAIEKKNVKEIENSFTSLAELLQKTESTKSLSTALAHLETTEEKLAEMTGTVVSHRVHSINRKHTIPESQQENLSIALHDKKIEEAIIKQNVPARFKEIVRGYFSK
ncbi:MAG: hypothetical protein ABIH42_02225, partial [Planctomycetota bacterium]